MCLNCFGFVPDSILLGAATDKRCSGRNSWGLLSNRENLHQTVYCFGLYCTGLYSDFRLFKRM